MAERNVLFVSDKETFIIKSIIKKVEEQGHECIFSTLDISSLMKVKDKIGSLVYLYVDEKNNLDERGMNYLKDICTDNC